MCAARACAPSGRAAGLSWFAPTTEDSEAATITVFRRSLAIFPVARRLHKAPVPARRASSTFDRSAGARRIRTPGAQGEPDHGFTSIRAEGARGGDVRDAHIGINRGIRRT